MMAWLYALGAAGLCWLVIEGIMAAFNDETPVEEKRCKCCWCEEERDEQ